MDFDDEPHHRDPSLWEQNHGNVLLAVTLGVLVIGAMVLIYRQNRFVKPGFPDSSAIVQAKDPGATGSAGLPGDASLRVSVKGATADAGSVMLEVYDSVELFGQPEHVIVNGTVPITDGQARWEVPLVRLPTRFAIVAFQDENGDEKLNRNSSGVATEAHGYSRNAREDTEARLFEAAAMDRPAASETIEISLRK